MNTITVQIQLDEVQFETLTLESEKQKIAVDELLINLVREYLVELSLLSRRPAVDPMAIVGMGKSDATDVSARHDYYFGESIAEQHLH